MKIGLKYKNEEHIFDECISAGVPFLKYPILEKEGLVEHGISTRLGGVSEGFLGSMNLSYTRGDDPAHVDENYRRMAAAIGVKPEHMVCTHQTHTTNVRIVTREDAGKGVTREKDYTDVDGLITNVPGICLVTFYADCVPLLFLDPVKKVVASSHSGWRGTVNRMGQVTVEKMQKEFGCDPKNILACVGPSICQECYEVSEDVIDMFRANFRESEYDRLFYAKENGKFQLDLWNLDIRLTCCFPGFLEMFAKRHDHQIGFCRCLQGFLFHLSAFFFRRLFLDFKAKLCRTEARRQHRTPL
jgi:YfiH family protein